MIKHILTVTFLSVIISWSIPVMAYIDPGSGSAIMSAIVGFLVAISLIVKTYFFKFKSFFQKKEKKPPIKKSDD